MDPNPKPTLEERMTKLEANSRYQSLCLFYLIVFCIGISVYFS